MQCEMAKQDWQRVTRRYGVSPLYRLRSLPVEGVNLLRADIAQNQG